MSRILSSITTTTGETTNLVPLGGEDAITQKGDRWAEGGDILSRGSFPEFSSKFPDNETLIDLSSKLTGLSSNKGAIEHSSGRFIAIGGTSVSVSDDNGSTWNDIPTGLNNNNIIIELSNGDLLTGDLTSGNNVARSTDAGDTWGIFATGLLSVERLFETGTGRVIAFQQVSANISYSDDNGQTWTVVLATGVIWGPNIEVASGRLIGGSISGAGGQHMFTSDDNGATWNTAGGSFTSRVDGILLLNSGNILAHTNDNSFTNITRSTDNGSTFSNIVTPSATGVTRLYQLATCRVIGIDGNSGITVIYSDDDGATWTGVNSGLPNNGDALLVEHSSGVLLIPSTASGANIAYSEDDGSSWILTNSNMTTVNEIIEHQTGRLIARSVSTVPNFSYSDNLGKSWISGNLPIAGATFGSFFLSSSNRIFFIFDITDPNVVSYWFDDPSLIFIEDPAVATNLVRVR